MPLVSVVESRDLGRGGAARSVAQGLLDQAQRLGAPGSQADKDEAGGGRAGTEARCDVSRWPWRRHAVAQRRMNCMQVSRLLQFYLDGQAGEGITRRVTAHLADCRRCGLEAAVYREVKRSLARREAPAAEAVARLRDFGTSLTSADAGVPRMRTTVRTGASSDPRVDGQRHAVLRIASSALMARRVRPAANWPEASARATGPCVTPVTSSLLRAVPVAPVPVRLDQEPD
ncbi:MAG: anti-sigma factor family protein [Streptosporangiaceae bacterium]